MIVDTLWQYPIKGLGGTTIDSAELEAGGYFPGDRLYAIGNGHEKLAATPTGSWMKKAFFLQLMKFEQLASLDCRVNDGTLSIGRDGVPLLQAVLDSADGAAAINGFFADMLGDDLPGTPEIMRISEGAYTDTKAPWISIGGTASLGAFAATTNTTADARRFRLNVMIETAEPFIEASLIGKTITIGDAELRVVEPVGRCAAIEVDPDTASRGPDYVSMMKTHFGHSDLGVFAEISKGGLVRPGDSLTIVE